MTDDDPRAAAFESVFDLLPRVFSGDLPAAVETFRDRGFRPARDFDGRPMMARRVGEITLCIIASPTQPLPRLNIVGTGAGTWIDLFAEELTRRKFQLAKSSPDRDGREIRTYSATVKGGVMAVTMMRPLATDKLLSIVAMPPVNPARNSTVEERLQ